MIKKISVISNPFEGEIKDLEVQVMENELGDLVSKGDFFITTDVLNVRFEAGTVIPDDVYSTLQYNCVKYPNLDPFTMEQHLKQLDELSKKVEKYSTFDFEDKFGVFQSKGEYFIDEVFKTSNILKVNSRVELSSEDKLVEGLWHIAKYFPNTNIQVDMNDVHGSVESLITLNAIEQLREKLVTLNSNYENSKQDIELFEIPTEKQHSFWNEKLLKGTKIDSLLEISYTQDYSDLKTLGGLYHDYFNNGFRNYIDENEIDDGEEVTIEPYLDLNITKAKSINPYIIKELEKAVEKSYNGNLDFNESNNNVFKLIAFEVYELLQEYETDLVDKNKQVISLIVTEIERQIEKSKEINNDIEL